VDRPDDLVRRVRLVLGALIALDLTIATVAFASPSLWFKLFHGTTPVDPEGLLRRMGANWAAFAVLQIVAWRRWRAEPAWLAVVAGARLGDGLTDWTYVAFAHDLTWYGRAMLLAASPMNWICGWLLLRWYRQARRV
jgi:hypothetical protein